MCLTCVVANNRREKTRTQADEPVIGEAKHEAKQQYPVKAVIERNGGVKARGVTKQFSVKAVIERNGGVNAWSDEAVSCKAVTERSSRANCAPGDEAISRKDRHCEK